MYVSKSDNLHQVVSRNSGMRADSGTFGKNPRFAAKRLMSPTGADSPWGKAFLEHNRFFKDPLESQIGSCSGICIANISGSGRVQLVMLSADSKNVNVCIA